MNKRKRKKLSKKYILLKKKLERKYKSQRPCWRLEQDFIDASIILFSEWDKHKELYEK